MLSSIKEKKVRGNPVHLSYSAAQRSDQIYQHHCQGILLHPSLKGMKAP